NSGTARDIDDALAWPGVSEFHDYRSPFSKYRWYQLALVHLGRTAGDLPLAWLAHLMPLEAVATRRSVHDEYCSTITGRDQVGYVSMASEAIGGDHRRMSGAPKSRHFRRQLFANAAVAASRVGS